MNPSDFGGSRRFMLWFAVPGEGYDLSGRSAEREVRVTVTRNPPLSLPHMAGLALALLLAVLSLSGCLLQSRQPIDSPKHALLEPRLAGVWTGTAEGETIYAHFLPDGAAFNVVLVSHRQGQNGPAGSWSRYWLYPTRLGNYTYFNARVLSDDGKPTGADAALFYFLRYEISTDGELSVWSMAPEAIEKAIADGLKVEKRKNGLFEDATIDASSAEIRDWLQHADQSTLFANRMGMAKRAAP